MTIGEAVRTARNLKGYTQEQLSEHAGVSSVHVSNIEREETSPTFDSLKPLAIALNLSIDDVIFPREHEESELFRQLVRRLRLCDERDLKILLAAADKMTEHL